MIIKQNSNKKYYKNTYSINHSDQKKIINKSYRRKRRAIRT